jgi:hypothetical protein
MPLRTKLGLVVLALGAFAACGNRAPEPAGPAETPPVETTAAGTGAAQPPTTAVFGVPLGAPAEEVRAACPGWEPLLPAGAPESAQARWTTTLEGIPVDLQLTFAPDAPNRLALLTFDLIGDAANEANFRTLAARARSDLGPGHATRCESEDGVPFDEYMANGWGGLKLEWREPPLNLSGELALTKDYGPSGLRLRGFFLVPGLLPDPDFAYDSVQGEFGRLEQRTAAAKQATDECTVDLSGAPGATILGLPFGASQAEVERMVGGSLTREHGELFLSRIIEGISGTLYMAFYDGCLAVVMFIVGSEGATVENYRKLRAWAQPVMGPGEGVRCVSEDGVADEQHIGEGYGYMHTGWRGTPPLDGSLRLERSYEELGRLQIVFEASYLPLREHAPHIDFAP